MGEQITTDDNTEADWSALADACDEFNRAYLGGNDSTTREALGKIRAALRGADPYNSGAVGPSQSDARPVTSAPNGQLVPYLSRLIEEDLTVREMAFRGESVMAAVPAVIRAVMRSLPRVGWTMSKLDEADRDG